MIQINNDDISRSGGLLAALSAKSATFLNGVLELTDNRLRFQEKEEYFARLIVHTNPHLDEYFAELVFRACLPPRMLNVDFMEQSLFSEKDDMASRYLWPQAAVFGMGAVATGGADALMILDEHMSKEKEPSCSQVTVDALIGRFPPHIYPILREVNAIDKYGKAHPQHLGNIIKSLHEVRFLFAKGNSPSEDVRDTLSPQWKRALVDAAITAVIYCLHNQIDIVNEPDSEVSKSEILRPSLTYYRERSLHREHAKFQKTYGRISSNYLGTKRVFQQAILKDDKDQPIRDTQGKTIPQLLLLPRICFACHHCWGEEMSKAIMLHFWEVEFQSQLNFQMVFDELEDTLNHEDVAVVKEVGTIQRKTLPPIDFTEKVSDNVTRKTRVIRKRKPLWLIGFSPASGVLNANRPILNYINKRNDGCGIGLLEDAFTGTKVLFKGSAVPGDKWKRLVSLIQFKEDGHWHDPSSNPKEAAPFILNGNKAHQYVPRSGISLDTLAQLVRKIFHS